MSASQGASQQASQQENPVLEATAPDVRPIANVIRGVNFGSSQRASVNILEAGFSIVVEEARTLVARAILPYTLFETYNFNRPANGRRDEDAPAEVSFEIELNVLLTVLDIFGGAGSTSSGGVPSGGRGGKGKWAGRDNDDAEHIDINGTGGGIGKYFQAGERAGKATGMRMTYIGSGHPLALTLSEDVNGPVTTCNLSTMEPEPHMDLPFDDDNTLVKIIMKSSWLLEALSELDPSFDTLTIICAPPTMPLPHTSTTQSRSQTVVPSTTASKSIGGRDFGPRPTFRLLAVGTYGSTEMDYPNDREVLQLFECQETVRFSYRFSHIAQTARALQASIKTSLRMNEEGVLSIQLMMPAVKVQGKDSQTPFIEFKCLALDEEDR